MKLYNNINWKIIQNNNKDINIPQDWNVKKICETKNIFVDGDRGSNYPSHNDLLTKGHCVFLDAKNITKYGFSLKEKKYITEDKDKTLRKGKLIKNDIVITTRGTLGNIGHYDDNISDKVPNARINSGMVIFRVEENYSAKFLTHFFNTNFWKSQNNGGGVIPQLTITKMKENLILDIPMKEQLAISKILSDQESIISKRKELISQLEKRNQFMKDELLSGNLRVKEENKKIFFYKNQNDNWELTELNGSMLLKPKDWIKTNIKEQSFTHKEKPRKGLQYLEIGDINISNKDYDLKGKEKEEATAMKFAKANTLIISTVRPTRLGFTITKEDLNVSSAFVKLTSNIQKYLFYLFYTDNFLNFLESNQQGATYPTIKEEKIINFEFSCPDGQEANLISSLLDILFQEKKNHEQILIEEEKTFNFLLEELMSGRLRVAV